MAKPKAKSGKLQATSGLNVDVDSFQALVKAIEDHAKSNTAVFRGVTKVEHDLKPLVGRLVFTHEKGSRTLIDEEDLLFKKFKERALPYLQVQPADEWDWLALAQHHGLPTRLLDWTLNPLVAAYFAVRDDLYLGDSRIYIARGILEVNTQENPDPFKMEGVGRFVPRHVSPRLAAQAGLFTIHPEPRKAFTNDERVTKIITIKKGGRRKLKQTLSWFGVNEASLFPGLDGLCGNIRWLREDTGFGRPRESSVEAGEPS